MKTFRQKVKAVKISFFVTLIIVVAACCLKNPVANALLKSGVASGNVSMMRIGLNLGGDPNGRIQRYWQEKRPGWFSAFISLWKKEREAEARQTDTVCLAEYVIYEFWDADNCHLADDLLYLLVESGAEMDMRVESSELSEPPTLLEQSIDCGLRKTMKSLLENGLNPNTRFAAGSRMLGVAIVSHDKEMVRLLLEKGAHTWEPDHGKTFFLSLAKHKGTPEIAALVQAKM
jgi:hypothetical protein